MADAGDSKSVPSLPQIPQETRRKDPLALLFFTWVSGVAFRFVWSGLNPPSVAQRGHARGHTPSDHDAVLRSSPRRPTNSDCQGCPPGTHPRQCWHGVSRFGREPLACVLGERGRTFFATGKASVQTRSPSAITSRRRRSQASRARESTGADLNAVPPARPSASVQSPSGGSARRARGRSPAVSCGLPVLILNSGWRPAPSVGTLAIMAAMSRTVWYGLCSGSRRPSPPTPGPVTSGTPFGPFPAGPPRPGSRRASSTRGTRGTPPDVSCPRHQRAGPGARAS